MEGFLPSVYILTNVLLLFLVENAVNSLLGSSVRVVLRCKAVGIGLTEPDLACPAQLEMLVVIPNLESTVV